jgi:hypothetical protein
MFILKREEKISLFEIKDKEIHFVLYLPFPPIDMWSISETGIIAGCKFRKNHSKNMIHLACIKADYTCEKMQNIHLESGFKIYSLRFYKNRLYVSGAMKQNNIKQFAGYYELVNSDWKFTPIPLPEMHNQIRKSFDEILCREDNLYLIDDIVIPKYLYHYKLKENSIPEFYRTVQLPSHCSYETYHRGIVTDKWLALFSNAMNSNGFHQFVSVFDIQSLEEIMAIVSHVPMGLSDDKPKTQHWFSDFAIKNDEVYLACKLDGVGIVPVDANPLNEKIDYLEIEEMISVEHLLQIGDNIVIYDEKQVKILK